MAYEPFARPTGIDWANADRTYGQVKFGDDAQQVVLFYTRSVFNSAKSAQMGSRQYENQTWVKIYPPGEKLNVIDRPVMDSDKRRFPHQWNSFLQNKTQIPEGTPVDLLFPNNPALADNLKAFGVYTIQQCAELSANAMETIGMGATDWKNLAIKYLSSAQSGTAFLKLRAELDEQKQQNKLILRQFEQLKQKYDDINSRISDPNTGSITKNFRVDAPAEAINANHPSQQVRPSPKKSAAPPREEVEQANIIKQVTEESFPTVDVTKDQNLDFGLK